MKPEIVLRKAKLFDISKINTIEKEAFPTPWSFDALFSDILLNSNTVYYVATIYGEVVAYGGMWLVVDECHVTNVAVKQEYHRRGIAKKVMTKLMDTAKDKQMLCMTLEVRRSNAPAQALYSGLGFHIEGVRKHYYSNPVEDALIMCCIF